MKLFILLIFSLFFSIVLRAQEDSSIVTIDSSNSRTLQQVIIRAYEQNSKLSEVPAAIGFTGQSQLTRFSNTNILSALNINPGVRMEERSPGSYRLNVRGSSIRSPFGVRDIKVYFNEIPLTDPGGNTYLNQLGFYNFQTIEVIKGPAGSLYGAGIGGAVLINSMPVNWQQGVSLDYTGGSFGLNNINVNARFGNDDHKNNVSYSHQTSDGYRVQTAVHRDVASWETVLKASSRQTLHAYMLYGDLYYQTPGALTKAQYDLDPRAARPGAGAAPGAVDNKAAIFQKTFIAGFSNEYHFNEQWQNTTSMYGAYTDFQNPGIRVFEKRKEPHFGGRTIFQYKKQVAQTSLQFNFGTEIQKGFFNTKDYKNNHGISDSLQTDDDINTWQYLVFAQGDFKFNNGWVITAGASFNKSSVAFTRVSSLPLNPQQRTFENKIAPRLAILKKISPVISLYASAARGFSTPTVAELLRSTGTIGNNLQPEDGIDYEAGIRGTVLHDRLYFDINSFFFHLSNTIVQRIDTNGVSYSVNAGSTKQNGIETYLSYLISDNPKQFIGSAKLWVSHTWHNFHYHDFKQVSTDFSGNRLPGISPHVLVAGLDIISKPGIYANITYTYSDRIALNDANTDYASSFNLLGARCGFKHIFNGRIKMDLFAGVENMLNTKYSLGNDINAAAGRYYNAAPGINYYGGLSFQWNERHSKN